MAATVEVWAPDGIGEIAGGADLATLVLAHLEPVTGDIVVIASKVVSKAEGRVVQGPVASSVADETRRPVARAGSVPIVRSRLGITHAMAGIDTSNVASGSHALLPRDPDASAERIRLEVHRRIGATIGVLISDTAGRAWRIGQTQIAIGAAGLVLTQAHSGRPDGYGNTLERTLPCVADELCAAAELASGKTERRPIMRIRGRADLVCVAGARGAQANALNRSPREDLFGFGAREAVLRAVAANPSDLAGFAGPADAGELAAALEEVIPAIVLVVRGNEMLTLRLPADPTVAATTRALVGLVAYAHGWLADAEASGAAVTPAGCVTLVRTTP